MIKIISFILLFCNINNVLANDVFFLNSKSLKSEIQKDPARIKEIQNNFINSQINENNILEEFQPKLTGSYSYQKTNQSFQNFFPVISRLSNFATAIEKEFQSGIKASIGNVSYRRKYGNNIPETRNALFFSTNIDLYKNFLGRISKSKVKNVKLQKEINLLQQKIDSKIFELSILRIYYKLILNEEAILISNKLLQLSKKQLKDLQKKYNNKIATIDDLERQKLEVISRDNKILSLKKERELYFKDLKRLLPNLADNDLKLSQYDYQKIENNFLKLAANISARKSAPMELTFYDDILLKEKESYKMQKKIADTHSDTDIALNAEIHRFDGNNSLTDSYENIPANKDDKYYNIGAEITIPFGKIKKDNEKLKIKSSNLSYLIKKEKLLADLDIYHLEFIANVKLIYRSLENQNNSAKSSKIILNESHKKYNQARLSLQRLLDDENMDLEVSLSRISISESFLDIIFNYLTIFTLIDV
jgi:outer membrane protein TolC